MAIKILMVCLGNICRSPLAEGILASKLPDSFKVDSAGTGNYHIGKLPDSRSIAIAKEKGIDITNQRARQFKKSDFQTFDYIYVMDRENYRDIIKLAPDIESRNKVRMILDELFPNENVDVPDPYFGSESGFSIVFKMLDEACEIIANRLKDQK